MKVQERFDKIDALDKRKKFVENSTAQNDMCDRFGHLVSTSNDDAMEMVDHPTHYGGKDNNYEAISVIEAWDLDFHCGSVIKYIARHKKKGDARQDIEKAIWYLQRYLDNCLEGN